MRFADQITPRIYLGNVVGAVNLPWLKSKRVTHIVNASCYENAFPSQFKYCRVKLDDHPEAPIEQHFERVRLFINSMGRRDVLFVHCTAGISRSVTLLAYYLMKEARMCHACAIKFIQQKRPIANPNVGFRVKLLHVDKQKCNNRKSVIPHYIPPPSHSPNSAPAH